MKVLITGVTGFCGSHLAEALVARGDEVWGICRHPEQSPHLDAVRQRIQLRPCDLTSHESVTKILSQIRPEVIYHLAGEASAGYSLQHPIETFRNNVTATLTLFEACRQQEQNEKAQFQKILLFTSSEMYGFVTPEQIPLTEQSPLNPVHPYAASKACSHFLGRLYATVYRLPVVEVRPFNQIGPRQKRGFVLPDLAYQIAEIMQGLKDPVIKVGHLTDRRDFTDIRDAVRAYLLLAERGLPGEVYHICSGRAVAIQTILDTLIRQTGLPIRVEVDPALLRPSKMPIAQGVYDKLHALTGWRPEISLESTVRDTLDYWQNQMEKK